MVGDEGDEDVEVDDEYVSFVVRDGGGGAGDLLRLKSLDVINSNLFDFDCCGCSDLFLLANNLQQIDSVIFFLHKSTFIKAE